MSFTKNWPLSQTGTGRYFSFAGQCRKHFSPWRAFINLSWSTMTEHWHSHSAVTSAIKAGLWYARCTTCQGRSFIKPRWSFHQSQVNLNDCYSKNQPPRPSSLIIVILGTCQGFGYVTMPSLFSVRSGAHTQTWAVSTSTSSHAVHTVVLQCFIMSNLFLDCMFPEVRMSSA